ncbi:MAG: hypothetical protein KA885_11960 [Spirochaetes bacterium]|nr:hypothetical protein [Spirochaetota bacterium]
MTDSKEIVINGIVFRITMKSRLRIKEYSIKKRWEKIESAITNLINIFETTDYLRPKTEYNITLIFCYIGKNTLGRCYFNSGVIKIANNHDDYDDFEPLFFHELVHLAIGDTLSFGRGRYLDKLNEGLTVYFQNRYYPSSNFELSLLSDRVNKNRFATGYYFIERILSDKELNLQYFFVKQGEYPEADKCRENILNEMAADELKWIALIAKKNLDFMIFIRDKKNRPKFLGVKYSEGLQPAPSCYRIDKKYVEEIKTLSYYDVTDDNFSPILRLFAWKNSGSIIEAEYYPYFVYLYKRHFAIINKEKYYLE